MAVAWTPRTPRAHFHQNALLSNPRDERDKEDNAPKSCTGQRMWPKQNENLADSFKLRDGNKILPTTTQWAPEVFRRESISLPIFFFFFFSPPVFCHLSTFTSLWMKKQFGRIDPFSQLFSCRADKDRKGWLKLLLINNNVKQEKKKKSWSESCMMEASFKLVLYVISITRGTKSIPHLVAQFCAQHSSSILYLKYLGLLKYYHLKHIQSESEVQFPVRAGE